jgi:hypothetical protein
MWGIVSLFSAIPIIYYGVFLFPIAYSHSMVDGGLEEMS